MPTDPEIREVPIEQTPFGSTDGWIYLGRTEGGVVFDPQGREIPLIPPETLPDGVEIGEGELYWKPVASEPDD